MFFKASAAPPLFADEPTLLRFLSNLLPGRVPKLLAWGPDNRWMLLESSGSTLDRVSPVNCKVELLNSFGTLQKGTTAEVNALLGLGLANRRPHHLVPRIEPLLHDELAVSKLALDEIEELRQALPRIAGMCSQINDYAVPMTLIHGDLHAENVAVAAGKLCFFDWTEACIAHPFMDPFMVFNERNADLRTRLRDAYLAVWTAFEPMDRLLELWSLCSVVHAFHHAVSYQSILHYTDEHELANAIPFLLRKALRYLRDPA